MTAQRIKVLHVLCSNRFSGAENVACQIIRMFEDDDKYEMVYCSPDGDIRKTLAQMGVNFVGLKSVSPRELFKVIKQIAPDVIHAHDMKASFVSALVCGNTRLISHIHNNSFDSRKRTLKAVLYRFAAKKATHIFWVSDSAYDGYYYRDKFKHKSSVLKNIINTSDLDKKMRMDTKKYDYDISYVGRLTFPKNPQKLMNVCRMLKEKKPDVKIAIIGTGDLESETKKLAKEYELLDSVSFLGFQSNPLKILSDSKAMVMTSRWEGTPMCALEALALGVPVVSTPTDGLCQLVEDGKNGFLSEYDEVIAQRLYDIITNKELQFELSDYAKKKSWEQNNLVEYKSTLFKVYEDPTT